MATRGKAMLTRTAIPIARARARWRRSSLAETDASDHASAACYRGTEDVGIVPIVVAKFEFSDVQRQVFTADLMEATHDATLQERPEAVDCLSVDNAIDVLLFRMANHAMSESVAKVSIAGMFVGS